MKKFVGLFFFLVCTVSLSAQPREFHSSVSLSGFLAHQKNYLFGPPLTATEFFPTVGEAYWKQVCSPILIPNIFFNWLMAFLPQLIFLTTTMPFY